MGALIIDYKLFPLGEEKKKKDTFKQSLLLKKNLPGHYLQLILAARGKISFL